MFIRCVHSLTCRPEFCFQLISLVKLVLDKQSKKTEEGMLPFNPKSAIFVCNRWDLVQRHQAKEVYDNAVSLLGECWPSLEQEQVLTFSTYRAEKEHKLDSDYITEEYKTLLESIKDMYLKAVYRRMESTYRYSLFGCFLIDWLSINAIRSTATVCRCYPDNNVIDNDMTSQKSNWLRERSLWWVIHSTRDVYPPIRIQYLPKSYYNCHIRVAVIIILAVIDFNTELLFVCVDRRNPFGLYNTFLFCGTGRTETSAPSVEVLL